jgi:hypothetical protein
MSLLTIGACSVDKETQITVALQSEAVVPGELAAFTVRVTSTRTNEVRFEKLYNPTNGKDFPTTLAVIPADEDSIKSPLKIEIIGASDTEGKNVILSRTSVTSYIEGRNLMLSMPLRMACFQFKPCDAGQTCRGGQCVADTVPSSTLTDFNTKLIAPETAGCFDEDNCLAAATEVAVADDCTFPIATADPVNVAIRWAAAPARLLALDSGDAQEGWTRVSPSQGKLSQGACDSHFQRKDAAGNLLVSDWAKQVYVTTGCAAKTNLVPYCRSTTTGYAGIGASSPPP